MKSKIKKYTRYEAGQDARGAVWIRGWAVFERFGSFTIFEVFENSLLNKVMFETNLLSFIAV